MRLQDKIAWITGAGSGIGEATARRFAAEGAKLALTDVNPESLERVAKEIGGEVFTAVADVTNRDQVQAAVKGITDRFGRLDILVNNAGITGFQESFGNNEKVVYPSWNTDCRK